MEDNLKPDDIRELLCQNADVSDYNSDSVHNSDIDSDIGEVFETEIRSELGGNYEHEQSSYNEEERVLDVADEQNGDMEEENADPSQDDTGNTDDEDEELNVDYNSWREWGENDTKFNKFVWSAISGYKPPQGEVPQTPLQFFQLFFDDNLLNEIVKESNRYAGEKIQMSTPLRKKSMWWSWKEITLPELKAFFGVLLNMGMNEKPELSDYFSTEWVDFQPFFKDVFSKERFLQIFWTLHVSPPSTGPVSGVLTRSGKIRNVVGYLDKKFREVFVPSKKVSVDESTVGYKGRVVFKVYNKDKPTKWGIKIFVLSDAASGYICAMEPYFGKITTDRMERQDLGVTSRIVLHLVNKLKVSYPSIEGLHVFTDRFYTNLDLAAVLLEMKIHITGTIVTSRKGLPEEVRSRKKKRSPKMKKGDMKCFRKEDKFSLVLWQDTKLVAILTTLYDNTSKTINRTKKQGVVEEVKKPTVICKYNASMGGGRPR